MTAALPASTSPSRTLSISSLVVGIASILLGYTFFVPIAGVILGVMGRRREPEGRTLANWGLGLSIAAIALGVVLWVVFGGVMLAALGLHAVTG